MSPCLGLRCAASAPFGKRTLPPPPAEHLLPHAAAGQGLLGDSCLAPGVDGGWGLAQ
eukprot:CAMPEP_0174367052 /NCGR_PEP_ID=MMETSP0811_2-20130205/83614_1 /TAXON_ID=73025 ORGANISM="Eutreptiella gymnastica-like, Strain CCMP1594" /NCGR_SAMPLE_ID=MMETSP0811_2 /ASSEMBLY_ACC=CAM_ASM_000667 /LENGTH=56 /DNA_ID=CAMNT_0015509209 /DNA_START=212 /DNA_END=379 /DNA_ORIENTATION=-